MPNPHSDPCSREEVPAVTHELKVWPESFEALVSGLKTFEYRKDDREPRFAVGDVLRLHEWTPPYHAETEHEWLKQFGGNYTGRECLRRVTYIARESPIIPAGFCIMAIEPVASPRFDPSRPFTVKPEADLGSGI